ncbi:hypothetical protein PC129_g24131 [Phytophthora cactorum]|uniref:Uncharacterized protein n=1 Tax=Phytophthora cactorum TaxID=29920 RepID=A0A8T1GZG5_9STRA|nr:hypothetical protein Pcac1_g26279 [Phytophthora cactorum]KAG2791183.1 hypothetical protein PC112_g24350 [Phytophthora cactorum]KAG2870865.1 hypothetical protein PC114_g27186 [Phytophthora cactorum]KAG2873612.1 hypothetical protein PC115_g24319 [Phytophthora cactorum]KAG2877149.1 hypothetical protein PC117_g27124 [Phytophthora cactorum]
MRCRDQEHQSRGRVEAASVSSGKTSGRHSMLQAARSSVKKFPRRMESSRSTATSPESCSRPRLPLCSEAVAACRSSFRGLPVPASCRVPFERVWD